MGGFALPPALSAGCHPSLPALPSRGPAGGAGEPGWAGLPESGKRRAPEGRAAQPRPGVSALRTCPAGQDPRLAPYVRLTSWSV